MTPVCWSRRPASGIGPRKRGRQSSKNFGPKPRGQRTHKHLCDNRCRKPAGLKGAFRREVLFRSWKRPRCNPNPPDRRSK
jgi:hypothetical protein